MPEIYELKFSAPESKRFGFKIYRGNLLDIDINNIRKIIADGKADILILRLPAETKNEHYKLLETGFPVFHCDTLVYYFCSLNAIQVQALRNSLSFDIVTPATADMLDGLVENIFADYKNHYFSNPVFKRELIIHGYQEWAGTFLHEVDNSKFLWLVKLQNEVIGFAMCSINNENTCEGVLYGVKSEFSGRGVYSDIIRFTQKYFKDMGMKKMIVSTQIQNYSVQKVWVKEGFNLKNAFDTYHINCFLTNNSNKEL